MSSLAIKDVAAQTGIAAGTIRMWEQRYGFPAPERTESGHRRYADEDVAALRRVHAYRGRGLSVAAAIERALEAGALADRPSIYAAVDAGGGELRPQVLRKPTLVALSRAIEHEALVRAASPVLVAAFQQEAFYRAVESRYRRLARGADAAVVFADFACAAHPDGAPVEIPIEPAAALGNEWALVVDAPGYSACLLAWEQPDASAAGEMRDRERRFEAIWTVDPVVTRRAATAGARLAGLADPAVGARLERLLADRPLALEQPAPALTALANRALAYVERV